MPGALLGRAGFLHCLPRYETTMNFDLYGFGPALAAGALMTVKLALTALCLGLVLGLAGALAKTSPYKPLQWLGGAYSTLVRGIPELLWVLLIYSAPST